MQAFKPHGIDFCVGSKDNKSTQQHLFNSIFHNGLQFNLIIYLKFPCYALVCFGALSSVSWVICLSLHQYRTVLLSIDFQQCRYPHLFFFKIVYSQTFPFPLYPKPLGIGITLNLLIDSRIIEIFMTIMFLSVTIISFYLFRS